MSDESEYSEFPGVEITTKEEDLTPTFGPHTWFHYDEIDDYDLVEMDEIPHVYIFQHERDEKLQQLRDDMGDLRNQFVRVDAIVWPDELDGVVQECDDEVLADLEWLYAVSPWMDDIDGKALADAARRMQREVDQKHE